MHHHPLLQGYLPLTHLLTLTRAVHSNQPANMDITNEGIVFTVHSIANTSTMKSYLSKELCVEWKYHKEIIQGETRGGEQPQR